MVPYYLIFKVTKNYFLNVVWFKIKVKPTYTTFTYKNIIVLLAIC